MATTQPTWSPASWREHPALHQPDWPDPAAVEAARDRWRNAQAAGHSLTYWQQTEAGWEKKV